mmetsp:Transcript_49628/g.105464  ORF Transcript_49628/g.105464 Transcript_49628/m.105464 type:complete len:90 (-) Transcript_49628:902-1171(-)
MEPTRADGGEAREEKEEKESDASPPTCPGPSSSALPEGWVEAVNPTSGNVCHRRQVTCASPWERPRGSGTDGGALADDGSDTAADDAGG